MPADKRVVAGGAAVVLVGAVLLFSGSDARADEEPAKPKPKPLTGKQRAIALAVKYARLFKIPPSLILGLMAVGGWKEKGYVANRRGGAWGYTYMTLSTAQDLTKRFPSQAKAYWPGFDGTGQSLLDPATNIALGAWQLSLQWKKFRDWLTAGLSYYTGAGRMATLVKQGGGRLPSPLPADVSRQAAAWNRVRTADPYVKKALMRDHGTAGALGAARPSCATTANVNALAAKIVSNDQARQMLGAAAVVLNKAYPVADNTPLIASWAGMKAALHQHIDQVNSYAQRVYATIPPGSAQPDLTTRKKVALAVLQANDVFRDVDEAVNDPELASFLPDFTAAIAQILAAATRAAAEAAKAVASALPWWAIPVGVAAGGGALYLLSKK